VFQHAPKVSNLLGGRVVAVKSLEAVGSCSGAGAGKASAAFYSHSRWPVRAGRKWGTAIGYGRQPMDFRAMGAGLRGDARPREDASLRFLHWPRSDH
jgi:hypothetical protein